MAGVRVLVGTRKGAFVLTSDERTAGLAGRGPALRGLGGLPPQGLAGRPRPDLGGASRAAGSASWSSARTTAGGRGRRSATTSATTASRARTSGTTARRTRGSSPGSGTSSRRSPTPTRSTRGSRTPRCSRAPTAGRPGPSCRAAQARLRARSWQPGAGGMCLHTIVLHPTDEQRIYTAISRGRRLPHRRRRRQLAADQQGPAVRRHPRPGRRGRPLRAQDRDAPVAAGHAVHAEALGRHAQRRRRRLLARGQRRPAHRLRLPDRRARARARDGLRRADH